MPDRMLIIGGTGLLGVDLTRFFSSSYKVCSVGHREMDITNPDQVDKFFENFKPHYVLHAAAIADVDKCEIYQDLAMSINADGTENVVRACRKHDSFLIYYSTDYVFDGMKGTPYVESDKTGPVNFYGKTKLEGERRVLKYPDISAILRVAWLYGSSDRSFLYRLIQNGLKQTGDRASGLKGEEIKIISDQISTPTRTWDIARQTEAILRGGLSGIFHCTAEGQATRKETAEYLFKALGLDVEMKFYKKDEFDWIAPRPLNTVLENAALKKYDINIMPDFKAGIDRYLDEWRNNHFSGM